MFSESFLLAYVAAIYFILMTVWHKPVRDTGKMSVRISSEYVSIVQQQIGIAREYYDENFDIKRFSKNKW